MEATRDAAILWRSRNPAWCHLDCKENWVVVRKRIYIYIVIYKYTFIYMFGCEKMHTYSLNPNLGLVIPIDYCNN